MEISLVVRGPVVSFSCLVFEPHTPPPVRYDAFCFRYVNTAPDNQVIDISQICIPAHSTSSEFYTITISFESGKDEGFNE